MNASTQVESHKNLPSALYDTLPPDQLFDGEKSFILTKSTVEIGFLSSIDKHNILITYYKSRYTSIIKNCNHDNRFIKKHRICPTVSDRE